MKYRGIIVGQDQIPVEDSLLQNLSKYDFNVDYSKKCIEANKHNHITSVYNMLLKKSLKAGDMTYKEAFECKNDISSLMRRQPRFKNFGDTLTGLEMSDTFG